jgi:hypothetical protein
MKFGEACNSKEEKCIEKSLVRKPEEKRSLG